MKTTLASDCAPLNHLVEALLAAKLSVHTIRDITRGGLATVANELAAASGVSITLSEEALPIREEIKALSGILGLDPLTMGNEGKMLIALPAASLITQVMTSVLVPLLWKAMRGNVKLILQGIMLIDCFKSSSDEIK